MIRLAGIVIALAFSAWLVALNLQWLDKGIETTAISSQSSSKLDVSETEQVAIQTSRPDGLGNKQAYSRPLFNQSRREYVKPRILKQTIPKPVVEEPVEELPSEIIVEPLAAKLIGISGAEGAMSVLIKMPNRADAKWHKVGENIEGWEIIAIDDQSVKFNSSEQETELKLYQDAKVQHAQQN